MSFACEIEYSRNDHLETIFLKFANNPTNFGKRGQWLRHLCLVYFFIYTIIYTSCHTVSPVVPECWLEGRKRVNIKITLQTPQILLKTVTGYTSMVSRISSLTSLVPATPINLNPTNPRAFIKTIGVL